MAVTNTTDFLFQIREKWRHYGPPREVMDQAGSFCRSLKKNVSTDWTGSGTIFVPVTSERDGNIGSAYERVYAEHVASGGEKYQVKLREMWTTMQLRWKFLAMLSNERAMIEAKRGKEVEARLKAAAYWKAHSYYLWGDGTGRISKGDGAYSVAGAVITLKNRATINRFEIDDVLVLIDEAAAVPADGQPTPRTGTVTVSGINRTAGTITCTGNITAGIAAAVNTDYIGKKADFADGADDASEGVIDGVFRWNPITNTEAATTAFSVTRANFVQRLSGDRINLVGSEGPWEICSKILNRARENGAPINCIYVPNRVNLDLSNEMKAEGISVRYVDTPTSRKYLQMGVKAAEILMPGFDPVQIKSDIFLNDINVTEDDDHTYYGLVEEDWGLMTDPGSITWRAFGTDGPTQQIAAKQKVASNYGAFQNLACLAPGHTVLASTRADD